MTSARPSSGPFRVVVVDADPVQRRALTGMINDGGSGRFTPAAYANSADAAAAMASGEAIILADMETLGGAHRVAEMRGPLIATSTNPSLGAAVMAMKGGAVDYLPKPIGAKALLDRLESAAGALGPPPPAPPPPRGS